MRVRLNTSMGDALGRSYQAWHEYDLDDADARGLIAAGFAERVPSPAERAAELLEEFGAGLYILDDTNPELVKAVKARKLSTSTKRRRRKTKSDGDVGS